MGKRYYWPTLRNNVSDHVNTCDTCQQTKVGRTIAPPVENKPVLSPRFSDLDIDVVGPMPESKGMRYLLTVLDRTTCWIETIPMVQATSAECCTAFVRHWMPNFRLPKRATSDNGSTFVAKLWRDLQAKLGTIVTFTPPFHTASLGGVKLQHRDIKVGLKAALLNMGQKNAARWMECLP